MSNEIMQDVGKILLSGLIILTVLGLFRDAGIAGFSVADLPLPEYTGPERFFVENNKLLTLDLNYYFSGDELVYTADMPKGLDVAIRKNILSIIPTEAGEHEITVYVSNTQQILKQKLHIKVTEKLQPNTGGCGCKRS